jgi:hypothetical protein
MNVGYATDPELKRFGKKVIYPIGNYIRGDTAEEKRRLRDEYVRQMFANQEEKQTLKETDLVYHKQLLSQI